ncbi:MAG: hypothetical protein RL318_2003 [Fibrobacterota bacterium]|jgi:hypothetical protein
MSYSIRYQVLPVSKDVFEGEDIEQIQEEFFEDNLVESADDYGYSYCAFKAQDIELNEEIKFVLFQFAGKIVASALLVDVDLYDEPDDEGYVGEYVFNADTVATFDPVSQEELKTFFPKIEAFGEKAQLLDGAGFSEFVKFLTPRLHNIPEDEFTPVEWIAEQLAVMDEEDDEK